MYLFIVHSLSPYTTLSSNLLCETLECAQLLGQNRIAVVAAIINILNIHIALFFIFSPKTMQLEVANGLNGMRPGMGTARGMTRGMARHDTCSYSTTRHKHVSVEHVERHGTHVGWAHFFLFSRKTM